MGLSGREGACVQYTGRYSTGSWVEYCMVSPSDCFYFHLHFKVVWLRVAVARRHLARLKSTLYMALNCLLHVHVFSRRWHNALVLCSFLQLNRTSLFFSRLLSWPMERGNTMYVWQNMIQYQKDHGIKAAAVIGGGLLGLEAAKAMYDLGMETHIIEYAPILMCRQARRRRPCCTSTTVRRPLMPRAAIFRNKFTCRQQYCAMIYSLRVEGIA